MVEHSSDVILGICSKAPSSAQSYKWRDKWFLPLQGLCHVYGKASHDAFYNPGYNFGCYSTNHFDKYYIDYHKRYSQGNACDLDFWTAQTLSVKAIPPVCRDINPMCPVNFETQNSIFRLTGSDFPRWEKSLAMAKSHQLKSWILLVMNYFQPVNRWLTVKIIMLYLKDFITRLRTTCTVVKFMLSYIPGLLLFPSEIISSKDLDSKRESHLLCFQ